MILAVAAYCWTYVWIYVNWVQNNWGYFGFHYHPPRPGILALGWLAALLPAIWMPLALRRPSHFAYWIIYLVVYIPSLFTPIFIALSPPAEITTFLLTLMLGFTIIALAIWLPVPRIRFRALPDRLLSLGLIGSWLVMIAVILLVFRGRLQLVSFEDVYGLRSRNAPLLQGGVGYAISLLGGLINPLLIARGVFFRPRWTILLGAAGQLLIYMATGQKGMLLSVPLTIAIALMTRRYPASLGRWISGLNAVAFLILAGLVVWAPRSLFSLAILFLVVIRTYGMTGMLMAEYLHFFERHTTTAWSHIHGVNWFITYPYSQPLGLQVGYFYLGHKINANASFWATDGLAGGGVGGLIVASIALAIVLWVMDWSTQRHSPAMVAAFLSFPMFLLANTSLASLLFSLGLGLAVCAFAVTSPPEKSSPSTFRGH